MFFLSFLLLILVNIFLGLRISTRNLLEFFVFHFLLVCAQIIILFELLSFLRILNQPVWFLVFQSLFLILSVGLWWKDRKRPKFTSEALHKSLQELLSILRRNKFFTFYACVILLIYLGIAALSMAFPQTTSDSLYNHLSRIGHWLQQGSLLPYLSFNDYAVTYPYNNSLLMMWSVLFLKDDILVSLTQWFSTFLLAASVFGLGVEFKMPRKASAYAALVFLTFPIVALEAGTAQNDILAAAFFICATWLTMIGIREESKTHMVFAGLALGLAIGTKQYVLYALPGLLLLILFLAKKDKLSTFWAKYHAWILSVALFTLLLGSYTYLQNFISFGNFFVKEETNILTPTRATDLPAKFLYNTSRLTTQFISCDGLPVPWNKSCLALKGKVLASFFSTIKLDLTKKVFLLEENCNGICYEYSKAYPLNEESAWYGPLSWILIFPGIISSLILSIKKKYSLLIIILLSAYFFFAVTAVFKSGWDAYLGRYLILSTALVTPCMAVCLQEEKLWQKVITRIVLIFSILIVVYSVVANEARPMVTSTTLENVEAWGKSNHMLVITKVAYKLRPYFPQIRSFPEFSDDEIKERIDPRIINYYPIINDETVKDNRLAIVATKQNFLDYYLFGDHFTRQLYEFTYLDNMKQICQEMQDYSLNTVLIKNDIAKKDPPAGFILVTKNGSWSIYQRK